MELSVKKGLIVLLLSLLAQAPAYAVTSVPLGGTGVSQNAPLNLRLAQSTDNIFNYVGSYKLYSGLPAGAGAMSVSGSTLYFTTTIADPWDITGGVNAQDIAIAAASIPTLTGTPAYDGSNAPAPCASTPCSGSGVVVNPIVAGSFVSPSTACPTACTVPTAPVSGAVSVQINSIPAGLAANQMWFIQFNVSGVAKVQRKITGLTGTGPYTISWSGGLPANTYDTTVEFHQWNPSYPFGNVSGSRIAGSLVYNGSLYLTGAAYYDSCNQSQVGTLGWILKANTDGTNWGTINTAANPPTGITAAYWSRRFAGQLSVVPSAWQSLLGGPLMITNGLGNFSDISCQIPQGEQLATFDPSTVTGGAAITVTDLLDYGLPKPQGALKQAWNTQLGSRSFAGPYPLTSGGVYYPATLSSAPTAGATTASFSLPAATVTATANTTSGSNSIVITAINSGTISNSGIQYVVTCNTGCSGMPSSDWINPSYDKGPGVATGTGTYNLHDPAKTTQTGVSVTLTPQGYANGYFQITFTDLGGGTESRVVSLANNVSAIPSPTGNADPSTFAPLLCTGGCSTSITVAPMGDNWASTYAGKPGIGFIEPNSRSLLFLDLRQHGPGGVRNDNCDPGASGANEIPLTPDTNYYVNWQVTAYDMLDIINAKNGAPSDTNCPKVTNAIGVYATCPYAQWSFPGEAALHDSNSCLTAQTGGWIAYDPVGQRIYVILQKYKYNQSYMIVMVWSVSPLS